MCRNGQIADNQSVSDMHPDAVSLKSEIPTVLTSCPYPTRYIIRQNIVITTTYGYIHIYIYSNFYSLGLNLNLYL